MTEPSAQVCFIGEAPVFVKGALLRRATMSTRSVERAEREPSTGLTGKPAGGRFRTSGIGKYSQCPYFSVCECPCQGFPQGSPWHGYSVKSCAFFDAGMVSPR